MASFTDQISQFNPYIQQLPVEAMTQVGMFKQQKYDEGIQKIQGYIDNVAGLDVIRDIDKGYLQSKLDQLGNRLKTVAAGDFSNFQLVNSVGGMATQIVKDRHVQNAVVSTKKYRKGVEDMQAFNKEGKGSPSNDWLFTSKAREWMDSTDLDKSFNETYSPYTNYRKNALEVIKSLTKDETIRDDAFDFDKNGKLVITDAVTRNKLAGISPEKIQQALMAGLTPSDWKQIEIDGRYTYSNVDGESFAKSIKDTYDRNIKMFTDQRTILENGKSQTNSAEQIALIDKKIEDIDKMISGINKENASVLSSIEKGDYESAKAKLYTSDFMSGFAKAFSFTETSQTYENNPFAEMQMKRDEMAWQRQKFKVEFEQRQREHADDMAIKVATLKAQEEANKLTAQSLVGYGGLGTSVKPSDVPDVAIGKVMGTINGLNQQIQKSDEDLMRSMGKDVNWLEQQRQAWMKSPNGVDPLIAQHFNQTAGLRRMADENQAMLDQVSGEADKEFGDIYSGIPKDAPNIIMTKADGTKHTYTPKDFVDFNTKINRYVTSEKATFTGPGMGSAPVTKYNDELAKAEMSPKDYNLYQIYKQRYVGGEKSLGQGDKIIAQNILNYNQAVNIPYAKKVEEKMEWVGGELKRRITGFQGVEHTIPTTTKIQEESLANFYTSVANLAQDQKGKIANSPDLNVDILRKNAEGGNVKGVIRVVEGTEFSPPMYEVTSVGAGGTTRFRITAEQKAIAFPGDMFEASPQVRAARPYIETMRKFSNKNSNYYTTAKDRNPTNVGNATLNPTDFPSIGGYGVSGNIESLDGLKSFSLRFNIYDPVTKKLHQNIPYHRLVREDELAGIMRGINDAGIYELLNGGRIATKNDMEMVQKASQKPF
jgi:hypothetical protein